MQGDGVPVDATPTPPGPARSCGACTMCCKVFPVPVMAKPRDQWCRACKPGQGCGIWAERPQFCRDFHCFWTLDAKLGPEWQPSVAKFVMNWNDARQLYLSVDPGAPRAYQREPYYSALKRTARDYLPYSKFILVFAGGRKSLLLPDGEHPLGAREARLTYQVHTRGQGADATYKVTIFPDEQSVAP